MAASSRTPPSIDEYHPGVLLTTGEVAAVLRCHLQTVTELCARGSLTAIRIGKRYRVRVQDLRAFLDANTLPYRRRVCIPRKRH